MVNLTVFSTSRHNILFSNCPYVPVFSNIDIDEADDSLKLFVGGLPKDASNDDLIRYFSQFGHVQQALIKFDQTTGVSRGFGFVLFSHINSIHAVIQVGKTGEHKINGKVIDPKQAQPHNSLHQHKLFVGGVNHEHHTLEDIRQYFAKFGPIENIIWPDLNLHKDKMAMAMRGEIHSFSRGAPGGHFGGEFGNFGGEFGEFNINTKKVGFLFIVFTDVTPVTEAATQRFHFIKGVTVEAKICDKAAGRKNKDSSSSGNANTSKIQESSISRNPNKNEVIYGSVESELVKEFNNNLNIADSDNWAERVATDTNLQIVSSSQSPKNDIWN